MSDAPEVVHVLPDKLGGVTEIVRNLLRHCARVRGPHAAVLVDARADVHPRTTTPVPADAVVHVGHDLPRENLYSALKRLRAALPEGSGVLAAHDWLELAAAHHFDLRRPVIQVLHGDMEYYYLLAQRHQEVVDLFVTYSRACQDHLRSLLPARADDVRLVPYGIEMDTAQRTPVDGPLRLCFAGRLDHGHKGVLDLPKIDAELRARSVDVAWTVVGTGPDEAALREAWTAPDIHWAGRQPNATLRSMLAAQDVFVLPTRGEGFPVALLEAMAAGLVPVVCDIRSGVPEVVHEGRTGFRPAIGDLDGFVGAIQKLATDRTLLETMSRAARSEVAEAYEVRRCATQWDALFAACAARPRRPWRRTRVPYGSRLDRPWLPNALVRGVRRRRR